MKRKQADAQTERKSFGASGSLDVLAPKYKTIYLFISERKKYTNPLQTKAEDALTNIVS